MRNVSRQDPVAGEFSVPDDVAPLIDEVHEFIEEEIKPIEEAYSEYLGSPLRYLDDDGRLVPEVHEAQAKVRQRSAQAGYYALHLPESVGGGGLTQLEHFYVIEEIFRYGTGHGTGLTKSMLAWTEGPTAMLLHLDDEQREEWLHPSSRAKNRPASGLTNPGPVAISREYRRPPRGTTTSGS